MSTTTEANKKRTTEAGYKMVQVYPKTSRLLKAAWKKASKESDTYLSVTKFMNEVLTNSLGGK